MKLSRAFVISFVAAVALVAVSDRAPSRAQSSNEVRAAYVKHEYQIAMRDGVNRRATPGLTWSTYGLR